MLPLDFQSWPPWKPRSQFVQIVPGNDTIVLVLFEIRMGEFQGAMSLCIPYLLIKPILNKLSTPALVCFSDRKKAARHALRAARKASQHD